ncbi:hypothetical protein [Nocardioides sp. LHG3406-4]|uniref:hypothetical protein n=1 Tax=Nocardioides sp. LHG3406-4 TaxID=2804575 RepID=UPI003CF92152
MTDGTLSESDERQGGGGRLSLERVGEGALLTVVTLFFAYMLKDSMGWPSDAALLPRMALGVGLPFLLYRWFTLLRARPESTPAGEEPNGQVMDLGFRLSDDHRENTRRFIHVTGLIVMLIVGIWLVGVEISVPLGVFVYLYFFANFSLIKSAVVSLGLLAMVFGLYDEVINAPWPEPVVWRLFG